MAKKVEYLAILAIERCGDMAKITVRGGTIELHISEVPDAAFRNKDAFVVQEISVGGPVFWVAEYKVAWRI